MRLRRGYRSVTYGHGRLLARAQRRPAADPEVGPRLRRERRAARRPRVGRARGVPVADRPGGRRDRAVRLRLHGQRHGRPDRASPCRSRSRSCSGATPASAWPSSARPSPRRASPATARPSRSLEWVPQCYGDAGRRQARRLLRVRARRRLRRVVAAHPGRLRRGHRRVGAQRHQGVDHQRRHRRRARRRGGGRSRR